jgi:hypothetical protein
MDLSSEPEIYYQTGYDLTKLNVSDLKYIDENLKNWFTNTRVVDNFQGQAISLQIKNFLSIYQSYANVRKILPKPIHKIIQSLQQTTMSEEQQQASEPTEEESESEEPSEPGQRPASERIPDQPDQPEKEKQRRLSGYEVERTEEEDDESSLVDLDLPSEIEPEQEMEQEADADSDDDEGGGPTPEQLIEAEVIRRSIQDYEAHMSEEEKKRPLSEKSGLNIDPFGMFNFPIWQESLDKILESKPDLIDSFFVATSNPNRSDIVNLPYNPYYTLYSVLADFPQDMAARFSTNLNRMSTVFQTRGRQLNLDEPTNPDEQQQSFGSLRERYQRPKFSVIEDKVTIPLNFSAQIDTCEEIALYVQVKCYNSYFIPIVVSGMSDGQVFVNGYIFQLNGSRYELDTNNRKEVNINHLDTFLDHLGGLFTDRRRAPKNLYSASDISIIQTSLFPKAVREGIRSVHVIDELRSIAIQSGVYYSEDPNDMFGFLFSLYPKDLNIAKAKLRYIPIGYFDEKYVFYDLEAVYPTVDYTVQFEVSNEPDESKPRRTIEETKEFILEPTEKDPLFYPVEIMNWSRINFYRRPPAQFTTNEHAYGIETAGKDHRFFCRSPGIVPRYAALTNIENEQETGDIPGLDEGGAVYYEQVFYGNMFIPALWHVPGSTGFLQEVRGSSNGVYFPNTSNLEQLKRILQFEKQKKWCITITVGPMYEQTQRFGEVQRKAAKNNVYLTGYKFGTNKYMGYVFNPKKEAWDPKPRWLTKKQLDELLRQQKERFTKATKEGFEKFLSLSNLFVEKVKGFFAFEPLHPSQFGYCEKSLQLYPLGKDAYYRGPHKGVSSNFHAPPVPGSRANKFQLYPLGKDAFYKGPHRGVSSNFSAQTAAALLRRKKQSCFGKSVRPNDWSKKGVYNSYTKRWQPGIRRNVYNPHSGVSGTVGLPAVSTQTIEQKLIPLHER